MNNILPFKAPPSLMVECSHCKTKMLKHYHSNLTPYCSYECGALAQPEHVKVVKRGETLDHG
jgi:hypothetical protein